MKDIGKEVIEKIREEGVKPYPRWYFILKRSLVWALFAGAIVLGGMATGVAIFQIRYMEWDVHGLVEKSILQFLALALPYFWLGFLLFFAVIAYYHFRKTETGYKYGTLFAGGGIFLLSMLIGTLLAGTMVPEKLDTAFEENLSFYRWAEGCRHRIWMAPEKGFLAGEIQREVSGEEIVLRDLFGVTWKVNIKNAVFRDHAAPLPHQRIKLIGKMDRLGRFTATEARPFRCGFRKRNPASPCGKRRSPCTPPFHPDHKAPVCPLIPPSK
jgi:hypothetical protein